MTISNQTNSTSATGTNTVGQEVPYEFSTASSSDIKVESKVSATDVPTKLEETTNYTVTVGDSGGTVTMVTAVVTTAEIWVTRNTAKTQTLDLETGDAFNAKNVEDALDKNTKLIIENANKKVISAPDTDDSSLDLNLPNAVDRASKYLTFDASGNVTATTAEDAGTVAFGAFGETMAATASASAANTALGMSAFMKTLLDDSTATVFLATLGLTITAFAKTMLDDAAATNVLTTLGFSTYAKTLINDTTAAATRVTLGAMTVDDIVVSDSGVVVSNSGIVTKLDYV